MILRKYETDADKEVERQLGAKYVEFVDPNCYVKEQPFLSTYDFRIFDLTSDDFKGWLEVKKKAGSFSYNEMIPITKWNFAEHSPLPCYLLIERATEAMLFRISELVKRRVGEEREIKRREDQPGGSRKVVFFPSSEGQLIYFVAST